MNTGHICETTREHSESIKLHGSWSWDSAVKNPAVENPAVRKSLT